MNKYNMSLVVYHSKGVWRTGTSEIAASRKQAKQQVKNRKEFAGQDVVIVSCRKFKIA